MSPGGRWLVTRRLHYGRDQIALWDLAQPERIEPERLTMQWEAWRFSSGGDKLLLLDRDGTPRTYDLSATALSRPTRSVHLGPTETLDAAFSRNGESVVALDRAARTFSAWESWSGSLLSTASIPGEWVIFFRGEGELGNLFTRDDGQLLLVPVLHAEGTRIHFFSLADGRLLQSQDFDQLHLSAASPDACLLLFRDNTRPSSAPAHAYQALRPLTNSLPIRELIVTSALLARWCSPCCSDARGGATLASGEGRD